MKVTIDCEGSGPRSDGIYMAVEKAQRECLRQRIRVKLVGP